MAAIFDGFSSGRIYLRAVKLADEGTLVAALVTALLGGVVCGVVSPFLREGIIRELACVGIFLVAIGIWFFFESFRFWKLGEALSNPDKPLRAIRKDAKRARRQNPRFFFRYWAFFFPRILLGILTVGIYLLAEVLPMMLLTYFCEHQKTQELMIHLEEIDHE